MSIITQGIQFGDAGSAGYLFLVCILSGLAVYTLWRGRGGPYGGTVVSLFCAMVIFGLARAPFWNFHFTSVEASFLRLMIFSAVSLVGFYFFGLMMTKITKSEESGQADSANDEKESPKKSLSTKTLFKEMFFLALVGAFAFSLEPPGESVTALVSVALNVMLIGATVRLIAFAAGRIGSGPKEIRPGLVGLVAVVTSAWMFYGITPLVSEGAAFWTLHAARWADVLALALVIGVFFSRYAAWGTDSEAMAHRNNAEMEAARTELAKLNRVAKGIYEDSNDLMTRQKEQALASLRKAQSLEKIFHMGVAIQQRKKLEEVLQMIVELLRDNVGFKTITLRLLNENTKSFETRAHVGLSPEVHDQIVNYRVPLAEFEKLIDPRFRISRSYFIKDNPDWQGEDLDAGDSMAVDNSWGAIDMLIVPLTTEDHETIGYLSVENPRDPDLPLGDVIETLENTSTLAVIGIRNAKIFEQLNDKDQKLRDFAEKLNSLNKMKSNFVATISHEFRTPLTSIKAYCDTLIKNVDSVDKDLLKEFLMVIDEESGRLMTLVEDILDFSQIESGAMKLERRPCNLNQIMISAASELSKNLELKNITLHQKLPEKDLIIQAEGDLIRQLVVSLLHNAAKFSKPGGKVWVRLEEEVSAARVIVEDDGIGIPEGQLSKVFEQFYQVDNSSTREHGGSGLGLALCKSIIDWHDGKIWVQNMAGGGARFVALIPKKHVVVRCHVMNLSSTVRRFEVGKFLELIVENIAELMGAEKVSLMLLDPQTEELRIEGAIGIHQEVVEHARVKIGEGISGKVAENGQALLVTDIETDTRVARSNNEPVYGSKSFLSVPIIRDGEVIGVVNASSPVGRVTYTERDRDLLELFAGRLAVAIGKLERFTDASVTYEKTRETFKAILESKRFVEAKDNNLIIEIVSRAAEKLGMDQESIAALPYILSVYDLGLSKIGHHIVKKPSELSVEDREEIETHTIVGDELLKAIEPESTIRPIVLYHHENFDGSGYPGRLEGEAIPLEARIVRVADSLRALISERPYQRTYTFDEAKEILKHRSGTFFDPRIVDAFIEAMNECLSQAVFQSNDHIVQPMTPEPA